MNRQPNPRHFSDIDRFTEAFVAWRIKDLQRPSCFDDYKTAQAKKRMIVDAQIDAREEAFEIYDLAIDAATEDYDRGVGPAWD